MRVLYPAIRHTLIITRESETLSVLCALYSPPPFEVSHLHSQLHPVTPPLVQPPPTTPLQPTISLGLSVLTACNGGDFALNEHPAPNIRHRKWWRPQQWLRCQSLGFTTAKVAGSSPEKWYRAPGKHAGLTGGQDSSGHVGVAAWRIGADNHIV